MKMWTVLALALAALFVVIIPAKAKEERGSNRLEKMDTDKDGKVSKDEWTAYYSERFTELDADGNGFITEDEIKASWDSSGRSKSKERKRRGGDTED